VKRILPLIYFLLGLSFFLISCDALQPVTQSDPRMRGPIPIDEPAEMQSEEEIVLNPGTEVEVSEEEPAAKNGKVDDTRLAITDFAQQFIGKPYLYGGNKPSSGFDCSGFTSYVMQEFEVMLPRSSRSQEEVGQGIRLEEAKPGDLLFFRRSKGSNVFHVSLVLSNDEAGLRVIHSTSSRGVVVDVIQDSSYWREKYITARNVLRK